MPNEYQKLNSESSESDIHVYKYNLDRNLSSVNIPFDSITCTDFLIFYSKTGNACLKLTGEFLTMSKCKSFKNKVFGWNKFVRPFRDKSIFGITCGKRQTCPVIVLYMTSGNLQDLYIMTS